MPDTRALQGQVEERYSESAFERLFIELGGQGGKSTVFGDPVIRGGTTIIPVARANFHFGFGGGAGLRRVERKDGERSGEGGGSGGKGAIVSEPIGYIEIQEEGGARFVRTPRWEAKDILFLGIAATLPLIALYLIKGGRATGAG
ncbi:MAG: spore germination protein GerW family protein [bacterium]